MEYRLSICEAFQCLAGNCPDHCCKDWRVVVDQACLEKWQTIAADVSDPHHFSKNLIKEQQGDTTVFVLPKDGNGLCVHLQKDGYCSIHRQHGEQLLPEICRSYPRLTHQEKQTKVFSMRMSCPEVARLVIQSKGELIPYEADDRQSSDVDLGLYLQGWTQKILNGQKFSIPAKIAVLAESLTELAQAAARKSLDTNKLTEICETYKAKLTKAEKQLKKGIAVNPTTSGSFWSSVFGKIKQPFALCAATEPCEWLVEMQSGDYPIIHRRIKRLQSMQPLTKFSQDLSRYLQASLFNAGFPLTPIKGNYVASFLHAISSGPH